MSRATRRREFSWLTGVTVLCLAAVCTLAAPQRGTAVRAEETSGTATTDTSPVDLATKIDLRNGVAHRDATVTEGHARIEVLSTGLLRLEYSPSGQFEDSPTVNVLDRRFPVPQYSTEVQNGWLTIRTRQLTFRYKTGSGPFSPDNTVLSYRVGGQQATVRPARGWTCAFGQACEAHAAVLANGAKLGTDHAGYQSSTGFIAGLHQDASATWTVLEAPSGTAAVTIRYANGQSGPRTIDLVANGQDNQTLTLPPTGSWDNWSTVTARLDLDAGTNTMGLTCPPEDSCGVNIDTLAVAPPAAPPPVPAEGDYLGPKDGYLGGWIDAYDTGATCPQGASGADCQAVVPERNPGLLDQAGWRLLDDTNSPTWTDEGWVQPRPAGGDVEDGYLFAYGHNYRNALSELARLTGPAPLLPRNIFGVWYSKNYQYTDTYFENSLIPSFRANRVPLDTLTVDPDWKADYPNLYYSWEWDNKRFPDPQAFLAWAHSQGLPVTLDLHPQIMDNDPKLPATQELAGNTLVRTTCGHDVGPCYGFDWSKIPHAESYFALLQPLEQQGVDFWWLDGEGNLSMPGLPVAGWINHLFAQELLNQGERGYVLARNGGENPAGAWSDHTSTIHFTGDGYGTWNMLADQASLTPAEASIGEPYVTDDIGSFHGSPGENPNPPDLYDRWVQMGTFQPILRLHSDQREELHRLPWEYPQPVRDITERFLRLRQALVPYTYTAARQAHSVGIPIARAMYLDYPDQTDAYKFNDEYMYGSQMLVAPITGKVPSRKVWFPKGTWVDYFTGAQFHGPGVQTIAAPLDRMPVYVKAGGIVPELPYMNHLEAEPDAPTILKVYSGANGAFPLYNDAGKGLGYQHGQYARTPITHTQDSNGQQILRIGAAHGSYPGQPASRRFRIEFVDAGNPAQVLVDHAVLPKVTAGSHTTGWWYDTAAHTVHVNLSATAVGDTTEVALEGTKTVNPPQPPAVGVDLDTPTLTAGQPSTVKATVTNYGPGPVETASAELETPAGWTVSPSSPADLGDLAEGKSTMVSWQVTPASSSDPLPRASLIAKARYTDGNGEHGSANGQQTPYVQNPVQAPYQTYASTSPADFGESGDRLTIATDGADLSNSDDYATIYQPGAAAQQSTTTVTVNSQDITSDSSKAGIMVRSDITKAHSATGYVALDTTPHHGVELLWDSNGDGRLDASTHTEDPGTAESPVWLKLVRDASVFTGYYSTDGSTWSKVGSTGTVPGTTTSEDVGVFHLSDRSGDVTHAAFSNFKINP